MGDVEWQETDLAELVQGVIDMVRHLGKYREKRIEFDCAGGLFNGHEDGVERALFENGGEGRCAISIQ